MAPDRTVASSTVRTSVENWARRLVHRRDSAHVAEHLRERWRHIDSTSSSGANDTGWLGRLGRNRTEIVPWLDRTRPLNGCAIVEVGCGAGASTVALVEQGARVTGVDVDAAAVNRARQHIDSAGLEAQFVVGTAEHLNDGRDDGCDDGGFAGTEWVIFWASLEHMTVTERLASLAAAWALLPAGGLLTVVETPNRLWPFDSHTSQLPFFSWLPDDLAFAYSRFSPRPGFGGNHYHDVGTQRLDFARRGRGVSYHEFDVAIGDHRQLAVRSCLQLERRRHSIRGFGWRVSQAGATERLLHRRARGTPRAWLQPFLYLTIEKP